MVDWIEEEWIQVSAFNDFLSSKHKQPTWWSRRWWRIVFQDEPNPKDHSQARSDLWFSIKISHVFPGPRCLYHDFWPRQSDNSCRAGCRYRSTLMASEPLGSVKREDSRISKYGRSILIT
ncbi:hypothetical protein BJX96DRAFT_71896 [Aspergillus floccosus]